MTLTDFNFAEDDFTAADLAKFELIQSEEVDVLNNVAALLNQMVAAKVAKRSQEKEEFYSNQLAVKELESDTFYNHSPCGYFSTAGNGIINKINDTLLVWLGYSKEDIIGKVTWQSLLSVGGKMYFETHYSPLLQMQGFVQEISFEMVKKDKTRLPILINTKQIKDENGKVQLNHSSVFDVSQRKSYEKELLIAKRTVENQNKLIHETNEKLLTSEEELKSKVEEVENLNKNLNKLVEYTFKNASIPIYFVLEDASIYNINDIGVENYGYTSEELRTLKIYDLNKDYDEKKWASEWAKLKAKKKITVETQQKKKDGTVIDVMITANYVKYGDLELKCSFVLDITEKKKQEKELKLVDFTFNNSAIPIFLVKEDSSIYNINEAAAKDLGYSQQELKAKKVIELDDNFDKEKWALHWADVKAKGSITIETTHNKKCGTKRDVIININYLKHGDLELLCSYAIDITEKKKVEQQLNLLDYSYKHTNSAMFFLDVDGVYIDFNQATANMLGYSHEEFRGKTIMDVNPMVTKGYWEERSEELKEIPFQNFQIKLKRKDDTIIDVAVSTNSIELNGKIVNFGFYEDITEKKKLEEQMKLVDYTFRNSTTPINIVSKDASMFDFNEASHKLLGYTKEEFKALSVPDLDPVYQYDIWPIHWEELKKAKSLSFETRLRKKNGDIINANVEANFIQYGEKELNCIFFTDITEKKKLEDNVKLSAYTIDNAAWGLAYVKADGALYNCNLAFAQMYGNTSVEEMKTKTAFDFGSAYTADTWKKYWDELKQKKSLHYISNRTKKDGTIIDLEINANMIQFGDLELNCIYANDVTEKKKLEDDLKLSSFTIENAAWGLVYFKEDGTIYDCNLAFAKMYGYASIEEVKTQRKFEFDSEFTSKIRKQYWDNLREKKSLQFVAKRIKKDGTIIDVEINHNMIQFGDLELNCAFVYDVTEKLKAEDDLKESNQRYEYATLATSDVIWEADLLKKETFISKNFTTFFGHSVGDGWMPAENNIWRQNINPDDIDFIMEDQYAVLNSKESNNKWEGEYRLKKADGSYATVKDKTFAIKDEDGLIIRMVGAMQDITKQRAEEERLRLMESVILNTNDAVLITEAEPYDLPGPRILFVNKAFTEMTGYSAEEVLGKTPRILQNEDTDRKELDRLYTSLKNWEPCEVTVSNSKKNGEKFWLNMRIAPVANDKGWYTHWIAVERDVTKQKEAALEKERMMEELLENNSDLKQFGYITTHNLRAPLTNLILICKLISREKIENPSTLKLIEGFKTSTYQLNETLNDLIKVLIVKEKTNLTLNQLSFEEIIDKVKESISETLSNSKAIIETDFSDVPTIGFTKVYLESIFLNLITNSIKYRHPERNAIVKIKTIKDAIGRTKLTFSDNGIGMDMSRVKHKIFGFHQRFHKNADSKGVGLFLIKTQINALGGEIEVDSEMNIGTTFTITFKEPIK